MVAGGMFMRMEQHASSDAGACREVMPGSRTATASALCLDLRSWNLASKDACATAPYVTGTFGVWLPLTFTGEARTEWPGVALTPENGCRRKRVSECFAA